MGEPARVSGAGRNIGMGFRGNRMGGMRGLAFYLLPITDVTKALLAPATSVL